MTTWIYSHLQEYFSVTSKCQKQRSWSLLLLQVPTQEQNILIFYSQLQLSSTLKCFKNSSECCKTVKEVVATLLIPRCSCSIAQGSPPVCTWICDCSQSLATAVNHNERDLNWSLVCGYKSNNTPLFSIQQPFTSTDVAFSPFYSFIYLLLFVIFFKNYITTALEQFISAVVLHEIKSVLYQNYPNVQSL